MIEGQRARDVRGSPCRDRQLRWGASATGVKPGAMRACCMWCGHTLPRTDRSWFERWLERANDSDLGSRGCAQGRPAADDWPYTARPP
jgi:hypothetical protein